MKLIRIEKPRARAERPWHEALPRDPRDPDVVRAKTLARAPRPPLAAAGSSGPSRASYELLGSREQPAGSAASLGRSRPCTRTSGPSC